LFYGLPGYSAVAVTGLGKQGIGYNEQEDINEGLEAIRTAAAGIDGFILLRLLLLVSKTNTLFLMKNQNDVIFFSWLQISSGRGSNQRER